MDKTPLASSLALDFLSLNSGLDVNKASKISESIQVVPRLLLVDDNLVFGRLMKAAADKQRLPFTYCHSVNDLMQFQTWPFDVALIDYDLGAITGVQLGDYLRKYEREIPLVLVSEYKRVDIQMNNQLIFGFVHKSAGPEGILVAALRAYDHYQSR